MSPGSERDVFRAIVDTLWEGVFVVDRQRRLRFWSRGAERLTGYSAADMGGGRFCSTFPLHEDEHGNPQCVDECLVAMTLSDGMAREVTTFMHHKAGHRFPARIRTAALRNSGGTIIGVVESFTEAPTAGWALARIAELEQMAHIDPLTGVANRRFTEVQIRRSLGELSRFEWKFGVVMLDVDGFKRVNDDHGHRAGDSVLQMVARALTENVRRVDVVGRWGGDEFLAVIKNVTREQLEFVAHKLSSAVARASLQQGQDRLRITVSAGATEARSGDTPETLVARADERMYRDKDTHSDRSVVAVPRTRGAATFARGR